ncbi:hypothetical protein DXF85_08275 [Citrobacter pasteurii]|uniref:Uncharacterized protein n=1 Tax=Citrobacter pasteurii TaxID=1563222 RepID=A0A6N6K8Q3_9ENTR|nr:hypothetical protein DXF85_08275 [Citrobacter pasteurii]
MSFTGQCAETIQETIGAHYTLKIIKKENGNSVSKEFCAVSQEIFTNLFIGMDKEVVHRRGLLRNSLHLSSQLKVIRSSWLECLHIPKSYIKFVLIHFKNQSR